jgi:muconolactone delta-isomerase
VIIFTLPEKQVPVLDAQMSERIAARPTPGELVAEGKTKKIYRVKGGSDLVTVVAKDDITAGDGAKHDIIPDDFLFRAGLHDAAL